MAEAPFPAPARRVKSTAGEVPVAGSFSVGLFPNGACELSPHPALRWSLSDGFGGSSSVDVFVASAADHQGLAPSHGHEVHPGGFVPVAGLVEIGEFANVVDLKARRGLADLAAPGWPLAS